MFCLYFLLAKLVPLAYGIKKLQISCVVEDDKVWIELSVWCPVCPGPTHVMLLCLH